jgi:predicted dehydrogenase
MIGGGTGSFIGEVHRKAAALDGAFELVAGSFSSHPAVSKETGKRLGLPSSRVYESYEEMIETEKELPEDERMEAVSVVTPNHVHFDPADMALQHGFHVIMDKPMTFNLKEALQLRERVSSSGNVFALTHTYTGYPMVKEAREFVKQGKLGNIRKVYVEYPQGWLSTPLEEEGNKQAEWRTDPEKSGAGGCTGDIGTHAANMAEYVTGLKILELCSDVSITVEGRKLDDDAAAFLKFENNATGVLMATQIAAGEENDLKLRVYGEKAGLEWTHTQPNTLLFKPLDEPAQIYRAGTGYLSETAQKFTRLPAGHPEGYIEAFANIYLEFHRAVRDHAKGEFTSDTDYDYPTVEDGVRGMAFIETMLQSANSETKWTKIHTS